MKKIAKPGLGQGFRVQCKRLQGTADARRRIRRRTSCTSSARPACRQAGNKADAVPCERLLMMIGLAGLDSTGPVDLLYQDESCHVMCKGHRGEG